MASTPPDPFAQFRVGTPSAPTPAKANNEQIDPFAQFRVKADPALPPRENSLAQEFGAGLHEGIQGMQGTLFGVAALVGRETGIQALEDFGKAAAQENFADAAQAGRDSTGFSDIEDAGGFFKWSAGALGQAIPSLATAIAGGGIGGAAAKKTVENRIKSVLQNRVKRTLIRKGDAPEAAAERARRLINSEQGDRWLAEAVVFGKSGAQATQQAFAAGSTKGAVTAASLPQIGATDLELQAAGVDSGFTAVMAGIAGGALEALPALRLLDKMFPGVDRQLSKQFVKDFAVATGQQSALEGSTEGAQEMIQMAALAYHDPSFDIFSADAGTRVLDAFAAGALVGAVTGGAADVVGGSQVAAREGAAKVNIPKLPKFEFRPTQKDVYPDGFEPADNTAWEEIKTRLYATVGPRVEAAVNSLREQVNPVLEAIDTEINPGMGREGVRLSEVVAKAHNDFVEQHAEDIGKVRDFLKARARSIYEAASQIADPDQRAQYVKDAVDDAKAQLDPFVERLRRNSAARNETTQAEVDNMDFDDIVEQDDVGQAIPIPTHIFGNYLKRPTVDTSGRETVEGFKSIEDARTLGRDRLMQEVPGTTEQDFDIRKQDDGTYVVEVTNGSIAEDINFNEAFRKANKIANEKKRTGNFRIDEDSWKGNLRGMKAPTVNLDTLAWEGMSLLDTRERASLFDGFRASVSKMLERGFIDSDTAQAMVDQYQEQNQNTINDPTPEVYAPVTKYPTKKSAQAAMLKIRDAVGGWPKQMVDVVSNADGTYSWGISGPAMFKRLRTKDPQKAQAILDAIKAERRAEKLSGEPINDPGGRDIGVSSDPTGRFAGSPDVEGSTVFRSDTAGPRSQEPRPGRKPTREFAVGQQTRESIQEDDEKTNPETKPSEFDLERKPQIERERKARKDAQLSESDRRVLNRIRRPAKVKALIGLEFDKDGSTTAAVRDLARFIQKTLGFGNEIIVMDDVGLKFLIEEGAVTDPVFQETLDNPKVHARNIRIGDKSYVYLSQKVLGDPNLTSLALSHELGHQLYSVEWDNLTEEAQQRLRDASNTETEEEFNEWMADQLAAWMVNKRLPKNAVEKFFFTVGKKLKQLFDFIAGNKRFQLNETYADFADAVARRAEAAASPGANPLSDAHLKRWFKNEGVTGYKWFGLPSKDNMEMPFDQQQVSANVQDALDRFTNNYPAIAKRAVTLRNWVVSAYKVALAPSTSVMKSLGNKVPTANKLVSIFGRENHGEAKKSSNYHQRVNLNKGQFYSAYEKATEGMTEAEKEAVAAELAAADSQPTAKLSKAARSIRNLFDNMHLYAREAGLPVRKVTNYFPRQFSREKLIADRDKIINHLVDDKKMSLGEARMFYNSLIDPNAQDGRATADAVETPGFKNMNSRTARDKFFDQYQDTNLDGIVANYINAVTKRSEFNRFLGEPMPPTDLDVAKAIATGLWDPKGKYHRLLKQARREGATDEDIKTMEKYIDANLGQLGRDDINPGLRKWMAGAMAYQNMRVLLFTVFASLPDLVGPAIRSGSMRDSFKTLKNNMSEIASNKSALADMARAYGIISSTASEHIMTEYVDNHYMPPKLRKWNDAFFKWTGLNWYTDFTRKAALAVGVDYLQQQAELAASPDAAVADRATAALKELGVTPHMVNLWVRAGKPTYESLSTDKRQYPTQVAEALVQFVDESIMRPNAAQRPILASHPGVMLFYHLKGYMYAVHEVVLKRLKYNIDQSKTPAQYAAAIAPAIAMMLLTAVGLELRELIQSIGNDRKPRTDRMDGWEYTWELFSRSGLTGITQLGFDWEGADDRGMSEIAGIGGPTLSQIGDFLSRPSTQTIPKALPVIGQLPGARNAVRAIL